jgi:periplasmic protein TonB
VVQFGVNTDGKIIKPKVVKSLGNGLDEEALRVVKLLPDFKPARQNNNLVAFRYTFPIRFALASQPEKN